MASSLFSPDAALWAARLTEGYATHAQPKMNARACDVLFGHLARWLDQVVLNAPVGDWPEVANAALDAWEVEVRIDGPRVLSFDDPKGIVRFLKANEG